MADVTTCIIGIDLLQHYQLLSDAGKHKLIDSPTRLSVSGIVTHSPSLNLVYSAPTSATMKTKRKEPRRLILRSRCHLQYVVMGESFAAHGFKDVGLRHSSAVGGITPASASVSTRKYFLVLRSVT